MFDANLWVSGSISGANQHILETRAILALALDGVLISKFEERHILVKFTFAFLFIFCSVNFQVVAASNSAASDKVAQSLHSQIKYVESEIMRVWVTIDALVEEISQSSDAITFEMHKVLAELYFYDSQLGVYLSELEIDLKQLDDPSTTVFSESQSKPINISTMKYMLPPDAFPVPDGSKIAIKKRGL